MNRIANSIKNRLSLRPPQEESLNILAELMDILALQKNCDLSAELEKVRSAYPICTDFERSFPSICFALATGVGKTRLMGAFIAYLYLAKGFRNFCVLAREQEIRVNVFNISKINSEMRGGKLPRIKRLSEYLGYSYFNHLSGLDDLVLLMDESHHYRADRGMEVINELNPILGL